MSAQGVYPLNRPHRFRCKQDIPLRYDFQQEINARLVRLMREAFAAVWQTAEQHKVSLRTATFIIACTRMLQARELRGLYP